MPGTPASYTIAVQLNGIITPGRCHHCGQAVTVQHGSHPTEPDIYRHYFHCQLCGRVGILYPAGGVCTHCSQASSAGGEVVVYHMPEPESTMTPNEIERRLYPRRLRETAVQMRLAL